MMITGGITIDTREFDKAMVEYAVATKKTLADVATRSVQNLGFKGLALTKQAEDAAIATMESKSWWVKYIAKTLKNKKLTVIFSKMAKARVAGKNPARFVKAHFYTREQARAFSKKIIKNRLKAVRFLKFFWLLLGNTAAQAYKGGRRQTGKTFGGFTVNIRHATPDSPTCEVTTIYNYKKRSGKTAMRAEALLKRVIPQAYADAARDMTEYAQKKMAEDAAKYSAK